MGGRRGDRDGNGENPESIDAEWERLTTDGKLPAVKIPWRVHGLALVVPVVAVVALWLSYDSIPDPMPTHWGASGEPDAWAEKSMSRILGNLLLGPGIVILTCVGAGGFLSMTSAALHEPGGAKTRTDALRTWHEFDMMQDLLAWFSVGLSVFITAMMVGGVGPWDAARGDVVMGIGMFGILGVTVWLLVEGVRRGDPILRRYPHSDGRRRKWLMFVEITEGPDRDRVMIDTGSGTNFTFNVATRGGRIGAIVLMVLLAATVVLLLWLGMSLML
ncbi:MAG: DUF1648 domain-containing protein [Corynebacterium sp.]|uniref:DUF1648 domain-containing protein n=1 Tax=Corynebacterium sp. TaxID=1720 RepID=UPI003F94ADF8